MNKKQIENIVWHIETNRIVAGDKQVLDDVLKSLKNFLKETAQEVPVQEQSNNPHILRIQNNTIMLDNFILKSVTSYKLSNDASKGISEININLIVNSSKIDF